MCFIFQSKKPLNRGFHIEGLTVLIRWVCFNQHQIMHP